MNNLWSIFELSEKKIMLNQCSKADFVHMGVYVLFNLFNILCV